MVLADAYIHARVELGPTLTNNDRARIDFFTTERLHTQHLWLGITSVSR